jgi:hypothetical protein
MPIYLAGPINGRTDHACNGWRERAKELLSPLPTINPMSRDCRGRESEPGVAFEIVAGDILDLVRATALLVYFDKPSVGTAMEVRIAHAEMNKPVYVVNACGTPLSPWLTFHATNVFNTLEEACSHVLARYLLPPRSLSVSRQRIG